MAVYEQEFICFISAGRYNYNDPHYEAEYNALGTTSGAYDDWHEGRDPAGITTQDPELRKRLKVDEAAERVYNFLHTLTLEAQMFARACGKTDVHSLEPEDLCALTVEASAMAHSVVSVSAGVRGTQMFLAPKDYVAATRAKVAEPGNTACGSR